MQVAARRETAAYSRPSTNLHLSPIVHHRAIDVETLRKWGTAHPRHLKLPNLPKSQTLPSLKANSRSYPNPLTHVHRRPDILSGGTQEPKAILDFSWRALLSRFPGLCNTSYIAMGHRLAYSIRGLSKFAIHANYAEKIFAPRSLAGPHEPLAGQRGDLVLHRH